MSLHRLLRPLWYSTLLYSTASDLVRLQRCSQWCYQSLHDPTSAEQLLRHYFHLTKQQVVELDRSASLSVQRLLTPLASLERQLGGQSPSALHRALLVHAICSSGLTSVELARPHPSPVPTAPQPHSASWLPVTPLWELIDYCALPDPHELTLSCVGLSSVQLWYHRPFWRVGWLDYLHNWAHSECSTADTALAVSERDAICAKLDGRCQWIGCVQPDPNTLYAIGYYYGDIRQHTHHVPDTFSRPGYGRRFVYSATTEADCQRRMKGGGEAGVVGQSSLPVVTFELCGSDETMNGHHLHVYDSLTTFLLSRAVQHSEEALQQVQQFVRQVEGRQCQVEEDEVDEEESGQVAVVASVDKCVMNEQLRGLPLYLSCFPMPDSILWNN